MGASARWLLLLPIDFDDCRFEQREVIRTFAIEFGDLTVYAAFDAAVAEFWAPVVGRKATEFAHVDSIPRLVAESSCVVALHRPDVYRYLGRHVRLAQAIHLLRKGAAVAVPSEFSARAQGRE